jgi:hypothetical protein
MNYWPTIKSTKPIIQRVFKGINKLDPFSIKEEYSTDMQNMSSIKFPWLSVRTGYSLVGAALAARVLGLGVWKQTELVAVSNGAWSKSTGGAWSAITGGGSVSLSANYSFANFKGNLTEIDLIGANGVDAVKRYNGTSVQALTNAPALANYIEAYSDRLWAVTAGNQLNFSGYRQADNWTTVLGDDADPGFIIVESNDGENISGVKLGPRRLVIFKPNSMYDLFGSSSEDFTLMQKSGDVGAVSNQAITTIGTTMYFVHTTGIYSYEGGPRPDKQFSMVVQNYVDRINPAAVTKCCAGTDGNILYIGLPIDSATECDTILEYDTLHGTWNVWKDYAPLNIAIMKDVAYIGGVEGQVRKVGGLTTNNGAAITSRYVSKPYGADSLSQRIMWKRAWFVANVPTGSSLNVYLSKKDSGDTDWVLVQSIPADSVIESTRVMIPTTVVSNANWIRYKLEATGPYDVIEFAREQQEMPIV